MAFIENIISITSDGKFTINEQALNLIVSKAGHCNNFALITIIGSKGSGKSLIMNCFHKYLEVTDKNNWSKSKIEHGDYFCTNKSTKENKSYIQMCHPLHLETDGHKTAVFLMDATNVFEDMTELMNNKIMKDVIAFYLFISSTLIFLNDGRQQLQILKEQSNNLSQVIESFPYKMDHSELFYIFRDWNTKLKFDSGNNYLFGLKNGKKFLDKELDITYNFEAIFESIQCFLMQKVEINPDHLNIDLKTMDQEFINQFTKLMQDNIFNQDEMRYKMLNGQLISASNLTIWIKTYIDHLNYGTNIDLDKLITSNEIDASNSELPPLPSTEELQIENTNEMIEDISLSLPLPPYPSTDDPMMFSLPPPTNHPLNLTIQDLTHLPLPPCDLSIASPPPPPPPPPPSPSNLMFLTPPTQINSISSLLPSTSIPNTFNLPQSTQSANQQINNNLNVDNKPATIFDELLLGNFNLKKVEHKNKQSKPNQSLEDVLRNCIPLLRQQSSDEENDENEEHGD